MQWHLAGVCPEGELVASASALVTVVAALMHVDGERFAMLGLRVMQRTVSVPLVSSTMNAFEFQQAENLLHGDLAAQAAEVDAGHGWRFFLKR